MSLDTQMANPTHDVFYVPDLMTNKVEEYKAESVIVAHNQLGFLQPKPPHFYQNGYSIG
ncbi:hypothetical protein [Acinetobacter nematophilus]|uniref:Uncharacterized protein n=1 Tax=Acinetobacter nematophilus TaxID=2994642 RepID=A0A9X3DU96_9GAMM|nr:hypothetical protein [Acinetobacter nematophilus]MCX5468645.1 hypothetical protein [Acinetobacter nematophilus]